MTARSVQGQFEKRFSRKELLQDPDQFVRACLWENPHCLPYANLVVDWQSAFKETTHLERLALVRNPKVPEELILAIFDPSDAALAIDQQERHQLALAALTNDAFFRRRREDAGLADGGLPADGYGWYTANKFLRRTWELATAWPETAAVRYATYRFVPAEDDVKAEAYKKSSDGFLRGAILENCGPHDRLTLRLAMKDPRDIQRSVAYATVGYLTGEELDGLLAGDDYLSLDAACCNRLLDVEGRQKLLARVRQLGHNDEPWLDAAERDIESAIRKKTAESELDEVTDDAESEPAFRTDERGPDVTAATLVNKRMFASRLALLAREQRQLERRIGRRLNRIDSVLRQIWPYAVGTPNLILALLTTTPVIGILFWILPAWAAGIGALVAFAVAVYSWDKNMQRERQRAQTFLSGSRSSSS